MLAGDAQHRAGDSLWTLQLLQAEVRDAKQLLATLRDLRWAEASREQQDRERTAQPLQLNARRVTWTNIGRQVGEADGSPRR